MVRATLLLSLVPVQPLSAPTAMRLWIWMSTVVFRSLANRKLQAAGGLEFKEAVAKRLLAHFFCLVHCFSYNNSCGEGEKSLPNFLDQWWYVMHDSSLESEVGNTPDPGQIIKDLKALSETFSSRLRALSRERHDEEDEVVKETMEFLKPLSGDARVKAIREGLKLHESSQALTLKHDKVVLLSSNVSKLGISEHIRNNRLQFREHDYDDSEIKSERFSADHTARTEIVLGSDGLAVRYAYSKKNLIGRYEEAWGTSKGFPKSLAELVVRGYLDDSPEQGPSDHIEAAINQGLMDIVQGIRASERLVAESEDSLERLRSFRTAVVS